MRVCDFIAKHLYDIGITRVYGLMGGGASGLNDGFIKHGSINYVCFHHEQGAGYAAYGESRLTNKISVVNPTTGCGGTNCITPLLNAWQDSVPVVYISGNVRTSHTTNFLNRKQSITLRKYGVQEHDIINTVKSITKYAKFLEDPTKVPYELSKAIDIALSDRKGPVWLDIPSDVQTFILPDTFDTYESKEQSPAKINVNEIIEAEIKSHSRPLVLAGNGIHLSNTRQQFKHFLEKYDLPFVSTYLGRDLLSHDHPLNIGTVGVKGTRAANFIMQNCDLLIILGCSLNPTHVGYDEKQFVPNAKKIMIDIDSAEYTKGTVKINDYYKMNLKHFFESFV